MSGFLDNCNLPSCRFMNQVHGFIGYKRNIVASSISGVLFFTGWWIVIDAAAVYPDQKDFNHSYHICAVIGTVSLFLVNSVSNSQIRGNSYTDGCMGKTASRMCILMGFLLGFGSLGAACFILFGMYVAADKTPVWPGIAIFLQNALIFCSSLVFKLGRTEDPFRRSHEDRW